MENFKVVDNPQHNAAYQFGFIQGIKLQLQKLTDWTAEEPDPGKGGTLVVLLSVSLNHANAMPTVIECGKFRLDIKEDPNKIVFDWIESKKIEMLGLLNQ